jgi:O-methyltransferase
MTSKDELNITALINKYGIISDQVEHNELVALLQELIHAVENEGAIVEFGCYIGTTSVYIRRVLNLLDKNNAFHVFDSFEGLPQKKSQDISPLGVQFKAGELSVTKKQFIREFYKAGLKLPIIHKGWFSDVAADDVPKNISYAFLDGDYYESVMTPLKLIEKKLVQGAVIIVDDYGNQSLPGAAKAVDEWCALHGYSVRVSRSLAVIHT